MLIIDTSKFSSKKEKQLDSIFYYKWRMHGYINYIKKKKSFIIIKNRMFKEY